MIYHVIFWGCGNTDWKHRQFMGDLDTMLPTLLVHWNWLFLFLRHFDNCAWFMAQGSRRCSTAQMMRNFIRVPTLCSDWLNLLILLLYSKTKIWSMDQSFNLENSVGSSPMFYLIPKPEHVHELFSPNQTQQWDTFRDDSPKCLILPATASSKLVK